MFGPQAFGITASKVLGAAALLLDTYTGAAAAYSLRKLRSDYSGSAIRVRESGGNTEADIGFDGNDLDETALLNHCGANDGFVVTWYDQSGNSADASQSTAAKQPRIVNAGAVDKDNGFPAITFDGASSEHFLSTGGLTIANTGDSYICTMYSVAHISAASVATGGNVVPFALMPGAPTSDRRIIQLSLEDTDVAVRLQGGNTIFEEGDGKTQTFFLAAHRGADSTFKGRLNGGDATEKSSGSNDVLNIQADSGYTIGVGGSSEYNASGSADFLEGTVQECVVWESDKWDDRAGIGTNVNSYYQVF